MKIALDVMGGDFAPQNPMGGVKLALESLPHIEKIFLVGQPEAIEREMTAQGIREIGTAMARIDVATQETAATAERAALAAAGLAATATAWRDRAGGGAAAAGAPGRSAGAEPAAKVPPRPTAPPRLPRLRRPPARGPRIPMPGDPTAPPDAEERHFRDF